MNTPIHSSTHSDSQHMPPAVYLVIMLIALVLGTGAVHVNREYAFANLGMLGLDAAALAVRKTSIDLLLLADIALFFVAALMPRAKFGHLRYKLLVLGILIWAFDCAHTYQARIGIVMAGQSTSVATDQRSADLRASIDSLRATASGLRQSAARQSTSLIAASRADGSASLRQAITADQRADALSTELAGIEHSKAPAEATIWGQWMPWKAFAESLLISLVGLVMFSLAGEMVRAARDASAARRIAIPVPAPKKSTALPSWSSAMPQPSPAYAAVAVPLGAMGAPLPTFVSVPVPPSISVPAVPAVRKQAQPAIEKHSTAPAKPSTASTVRSAKPDAGTAGTAAAARYQRIASAVIAGTLKPSVRSLQQAEGGGTLAARRFLEQLASAGLIERAGQGWQRTASAAPAQSQLTLAGV